MPALELVGKVVSSGQMMKTAKVLVTRLVRHPLTQKTIRVRKNYLAHDEEGQRLAGDMVRIRECRPLSKRKRFEVIEVLSEARRFRDPTTGNIFTNL